MTRETAHNHYSWTKAIADLRCLQFNDRICADGATRIKISTIRPCSGIYGGRDRMVLEKFMGMGVVPSVSSKPVMDWIYVDNVSLLRYLPLRSVVSGATHVSGFRACV